MENLEEFKKKLEENRPFFHALCDTPNLELIRVCEWFIQQNASGHYLLDDKRCQNRCIYFNVQYEKYKNGEFLPAMIKYEISYYDSLQLVITGRYAIISEKMEHCASRELLKIDFKHFYQLWMSDYAKN